MTFNLFTDHTRDILTSQLQTLGVNAQMAPHGHSGFSGSLGVITIADGPICWVELDRSRSFYSARCRIPDPRLTSMHVSDLDLKSDGGRAGHREWSGNDSGLGVLESLNADSRLNSELLKCRGLGITADSAEGSWILDLSWPRAFIGFGSSYDALGFGRWACYQDIGQLLLAPFDKLDQTKRDLSEAKSLEEEKTQEATAAWVGLALPLIPAAICASLLIGHASAGDWLASVAAPVGLWLILLLLAVYCIPTFRSLTNRAILPTFIATGPIAVAMSQLVHRSAGRSLDWGSRLSAWEFGEAAFRWYVVGVAGIFGLGLGYLSLRAVWGFITAPEKGVDQGEVDEEDP